MYESDEVKIIRRACYTVWSFANQTPSYISFTHKCILLYGNWIIVPNFLPIDMEMFNKMFCCIRWRKADSDTHNTRQANYFLVSLKWRFVVVRWCECVHNQGDDVLECQIWNFSLVYLIFWVFNVLKCTGEKFHSFQICS